MPWVKIMQKTEENEQVYDNGFHPKEVHLKDNYKFYLFTFFNIKNVIYLFNKYEK